MNKVNGNAPNDTTSDWKININETKENIIMCPAVMFANKRIIKAKGLVITPINSIGANNNLTGTGTPGIHNIWPQ